MLRLHPSMHTVSVKRGEPASLTMVVCADPRPQLVAWEWGSLRLEAGTGIGAYTQRQLVHFIGQLMQIQLDACVKFFFFNKPQLN